MAIQPLFWDELEQALQKKKWQVAIHLLEKELAKVVDPLEVATLCRRLAHLYEQPSEHKNLEKAARYLALTIEAYTNLGRMAPAVALLNQVKAMPGTEKLAENLHLKLSQTFSLPPRRTRKQDEDLPPPTPFQEMRAFVTFEQEDESALRHQWSEDTKIQKAPLFSWLKAAEVSALIHLASLRELSPGATLFREGDEAAAFYIVADGEMELTTSSGFTKPFKEGDWFGEIALLGGLRRTATLKSPSGATLLEFSSEGLKKCFELNPTLELKVMHFYELRLFVNSAARHPLFRGMSNEDLEVLWDELISLRIPSGRVLFDDGLKKDRFYLLTRGAVAGFSGKKKVVEFEAGQFVGPSQQLTRVVADTECYLLECHESVLASYLKRAPNLLKAFDSSAPFDFFGGEETEEISLNG